MSNFFDPFKLSTWHRCLRVWLFIAKWLILLLSASIEIWLRWNFGRRYLLRLILAFMFYSICASLVPPPNTLTGLFDAGLFAALACHSIQIVTRRHRSIAEPYTLSTGDSWLIGQFLKCPQTTFQRYVEPAFCFFVGYLIARVDPFLHLWLEVSAIALFLKEQLSKIRMTRRILDSLDAKHQAQALNAALKGYQQAPSQGAQRSHRAHLPINPHPPAGGGGIP